MTAALDAYREHQLARGTAPGSAATTRRRLAALLRLELDRPVSDLTRSLAARVLERYRTEPCRTGEPPKTATVQGALREIKGWAGWLRRNPFEGLEVLGAAAAGKPQLTRDEARKLERLCLGAADHDPGAVAVLLTLYTGIRASELVGLTSRDLDDGGALLRVRRSKKRGRIVEDLFPVPEWLQAPLQGLADSGHLFGGRDRYWLRDACRRLCKAAGVTVVGPHGLRGTVASLSREAVGLSPEQIRALLGHDSVAVTARHYIGAGAETAASVRERLQVLEGGLK